jgi:hypothetical protein
MRGLLRPSLLSLLLATAACAGSSSSGTTEGTPEGAGRLRIENRSNKDMDIFIRPQARGAVRVGFVPGGDTANFTLSPALISGANSFFIEARPIGGGGSPTVSEPFNARVGEEVFWSIPP